MILVKKGGQKMWVKDPKKIKFWKAMAKRSSSKTLQGDEGEPVIKILKEVK